MTRKGSQHKVVYRSQDWTLTWPCDQWLALTEDQQTAVIVRQKRLCDRLKHKMARRKRSAQEKVPNV
jgi:hypothetical protein